MTNEKVEELILDEGANSKLLEGITNAIEAAQEMFLALPKTKKGEFVGHWNEIAVALQQAKSHIEKGA